MPSKKVLCPACENGIIYKMCGSCGGHGCLPCGETGEQAVGDCTLCGGSEEVDSQVSVIYQAYSEVKRYEPNWDGDSGANSGVTMYSLAEYWLKRKILQAACTHMRMRTDIPEVDYAVEFYCHGRLMLMLQGFCWGYSGEGPSGLAAIMYDIFPKYFEDLNDCLHYIAKQPQTSNWGLTEGRPLP